MTACVLSLLDFPYDERGDALHRLFVDDFEIDGAWIYGLIGFATAAGHVVHTSRDAADVPDMTHVIAAGSVIRSRTHQHAVIVRTPEMEVVHDPHPSNDGLATKPDWFLWFTPLIGGSKHDVKALKN